MKSIDYYMSLPYRLEVVTCGDDIYKAVENAVDAKRLWLSSAIEDGVEIKEPAIFDYSDFMSKFSRNAPKRERVFA